MSVLSEAHLLGIVHRDIDNLFITHRSDGTPLLKLLDFGISKIPGKASQPICSAPNRRRHTRDWAAISSRAGLCMRGELRRQ